MHRCDTAPTPDRVTPYLVQQTAGAAAVQVAVPVVQSAGPAVFTGSASYARKDLKAACDVLRASGQKAEIIKAAKLVESACCAAFNDLRRHCEQSCEV